MKMQEGLTAMETLTDDEMMIEGGWATVPFLWVLSAGSVGAAVGAAIYEANAVEIQDALETIF